MGPEPAIVILPSRNLLRQILAWRGRLSRLDFWLLQPLAWTALFNAMALGKLLASQTFLTVAAAAWLYVAGALCAKRMRDTGRSVGWLFLVLLPILGPVLVGLWLFLKGSRPDPSDPVDYLQNPTLTAGGGSTLVNDVTGMNPALVNDVVAPTSVQELRDYLIQSRGPVSLGGGRFSMGGQTAQENTTYIDLRGLNQVLEVRPEERTATVQPGVRWCDLQRALDKHDLSIKVMQTYANFTVGGSLSVNCHGRYIGLGPLILSVRSLKIVLPNGEEKSASPDENSELFFGAVGCYGALGIVSEITLELASNTPLRREVKKLLRSSYLKYFREVVRDDPTVVLHNADLYPPDYERCLAISWKKVEQPHTLSARLQIPHMAYPIHRYFYWAVTETPFGTWRRERLVDPFFYRKRITHWRNFEAGYDVRELEPASRDKSTYVLQEYFAPVARFDEFSTKMDEILSRHRVNAVNVSVRHAHPDSGNLLAWATEEVFAFVLYYKQRTSPEARAEVAQWTRELIDASLQCGGRYYLPYQPHATPEQFHAAYPRAKELFELKRRYDPDYRLRNCLWSAYYTP